MEESGRGVGETARKAEEVEYCQLTSPLQTNSVWCSKERAEHKVDSFCGGGGRKFTHFAKLFFTVTTTVMSL